MSEMLDRIGRRSSQRPKVSRDTSLTNGQSTELAAAPTRLSSTDAAASIEAKLAALPEVTSRRSVRIEKSLFESLSTFCQQHGITIETFLEASYIASSAEPELQSQIVIEAQRRMEERKQAGKLRRILAQLNTNA
ncbi:MAG: hypothetical protein DCF15_13970 [Phormidesmis priestleyi]|uniref:Uncharacterized protein n=1 Tax=Phormidesmis priestleyi TaxID=268141 RepID=A0A2W4XCT6_9CYAN|nr:MAG: hypothetical protein DCF15_13970 [Phormidesmis priestleyi]